MTKAMCTHCNRVTDHKHLHDAAHGIDGTHMAGSERYQCVVCGHAIFKEQAQEDPNLKFILD